MTHQRFKYREEGINTSRIETVENTKYILVQILSHSNQGHQSQEQTDQTDVSIHLQCECGLNEWRFICEHSECLECVEWVCMKSKALVLLSVWSPFWSETKYQTRLLNTSEFYFHGACWECIGNLNAGLLGGRPDRGTGSDRGEMWCCRYKTVAVVNAALESYTLTHHLEVVNWVLVYLTSSAEWLTSYQQLCGEQPNYSARRRNWPAWSSSLQRSDFKPQGLSSSRPLTC